MDAAKSAVLAAKARMAMAKFRDSNVDMRRALSFSVKSAVARRLAKQKQLKLKGSIQPIRPSIFEPISAALKRIQAEAEGVKPPANYGAKPSKVAQTVRKYRRDVERKLGGAGKSEAGSGFQTTGKVARPHTASLAGRRAAEVRRLAKQPKLSAAAPSSSVVDEDAFAKWMSTQF